MMMAEDARRDAEEAERDMARRKAVMGDRATSLVSEAMSAKQRMMDKRLMMKVCHITKLSNWRTAFWDLQFLLTLHHSSCFAQLGPGSIHPKQKRNINRKCDTHNDKV